MEKPLEFHFVLPPYKIIEIKHLPIKMNRSVRFLWDFSSRWFIFVQKYSLFVVFRYHFKHNFNVEIIL